MDNIHVGKETTVTFEKKPLVLVLNHIQDGSFLGLLTNWGGGAKRPPLSKICHISYNSETLYSYTLSKEDRKIYKSHYTSPEF